MNRQDRQSGVKVSPIALYFSSTALAIKKENRFGNEKRRCSVNLAK
jgi:hypothetical protein